jgi:DNA/RNA-binding domain of Phe-tRNA-synthetase-like protein
VRITIDESFRSLFPEALIGVIVASEIDNLRSREEAARELETAVEEAKATAGDDDLAAHPAVAPWREAYRRFGVKPSAHRSSIEGLLRSLRSRGIPSVNPLVDLYNAVSLRHLLPCGGEDLDAIQGDLRLTVATGGESFVPLGGTETQPPQPGEVVYADDAGIVCRAWNWREADRTKLTTDTRRAVLVIEALPPRIAADLQLACFDLAGLVETYLGATCRVTLLGYRGSSEASLDA